MRVANLPPLNALSSYDIPVTLAARLLLAIAAVTLTTAALAGLAVREAWRSAEENRFAAEFQAGKSLLARELEAELGALGPLVGPLCEHDPIVDSALVGLRGGDLSTRRLSMELRVPELGRALALDELYLVSSRHEVLGSLGPRASPERARALSARIRQGGPPVVRASEPLAVEATCRRGEGRDFVGLYAARDVDALLARIGTAFDFRLARGEAPPDPAALTETLRLPELGGVTITASRSRLPLLRAVRGLDTTLIAIGATAVVGSLIAAWLLSRGLARPIVEMSVQARAVSHGEPQPVAPGGGKELEEFAASFNRAIADLVALRKRLAATERIAARREIARRVAHEIKNPLAPIRAAVETLRRLRARGDTAFDDYFDEATRTVLGEVARISNIVSEFTRFARLPPPRPAAMDLVEVARAVVGLHASEAIPVTLTGDDRLELVADRDQMTQVLTNLTQNALDAVRGRAGGAVNVDVRRHGEHATLTVSDNGPGFSAEVAAHLFEPYFTTKAEGTGLGLAIVERIVVEHAGSIRLDDTTPGARLVIELPLSGPTLLPESAAPSSERELTT
jgi:two-component system nitrogen regulation sensor histidine kinase NtrY